MDRLGGIGLALGVIALGASTQPEDSRNAATWYLRAIEHVQTANLTPQEQATLLAFRAGDGAPPSPEIRAILARLEPAFAAARRGTVQEVSDFTIDYDEGFELLLPHLSPMSDVARLMAAGAEARLAAGDAAGAAGDVSALFRMAGHVGRDEITISSLVGASIFDRADAFVRDAVDRGALDEARSMQLLDGLDALAGDDPFGTIDALRQEKAMVTDWFGRKYAEQQDRRDMLDELNELVVGDEPPDALAAALLLDEGRFQAELDETGHVMDRAIEIFQGDDPVQAQMELERLAEDIQRGDHGVLARELVPSFTKLYEHHVKARDRIADRRAQLLAIATGQLPPEALANAAVWYLRAIDAMDKVDPEAWRGVRMLLADTTEVPDDEAVRACEQGAQALELLATAAAMARCDFSIARPDVVAVPDYVPPLRDAARLLAADALRLLAAGEPAAAARRLVTCDRMGAHLAGDRVIAGSLAAHAAFAAMTELMRAALADGRLTEAALPILTEGVGSTSRRDPFGHLAARGAAREAVAVWIARAARPEDLRHQARQAADRLETGALLSLLIMRDAIAGHELPPLAPLGDVLDGRAVADARAAARQVHERLAIGDYTVLEEPMPPVSRIDDPVTSARPLLGQAFTALRAKADS